MSTEENKALARRFAEDIINRGNVDMVDEIYAPEYVDHDPNMPEDVHGPEGVKETYNMILGAFPDSEVTIEDQVAEGDKVVTRFRTRGTHQGETEAFGPPTGNQFEVTGITIEQFSEEGKIVEDWTNIDAVGLMQQLGLGPEQQQ